VSVVAPEGTIAYTLNAQTTGALAYTINKITGPDGVSTNFTYDTFGRVATQSFGGSAALPMTFAYGTGAELGSIRATDALGRTVQLQIGEFGQVTAAIDAAGHELDLAFDRIGRLAGVASAAGQAAFTRNALGNTTSVLTSSGAVTRFNHDASSQKPESLVDPLGRITDSVYDERGLIAVQVGPDGGSEFFGHDAAGNRVFARTVGGTSVRDTLNAKGLVTRREFSDGSRLDFTYDARRNAIAVVETPVSGTARTVNLEYDSDRLVKVTYPGGRFVSYHYNANGQRDQVSTSTGLVFNYEFDSFGRLITVRLGGAVQVTYGYDSVGRLATKTFANGTTTSFSYDMIDRVTRIEHRGPGGGMLGFQDYSYSSRGLVSATTTSDGTTSYEYDSDGQLVRATLPDDSVIDYSVDALGNRVGFTVNDRNQYATSPDGDTFQYDANGNLTRVTTMASGITASYSYDGRGRLASVTNAAGTWQFEYDPLGNRSAVIKDGVRTDLLIDAAGGSDGLADVLAEFNGATQTASYLLGDGVEVRFDANGAGTFYHFDAIGNTSMLTDSSGTVSANYRYLPFGEITDASGPAVAANPFTFNGRHGVADRGNGLYDMRSRFYSPALGRFTQPDPIGFSGGDVNVQRFAINNPVSFTDPSGLTLPPSPLPPAPWFGGGLTLPPLPSPPPAVTQFRMPQLPIRPSLLNLSPPPGAVPPAPIPPPPVPPPPAPPPPPPSPVVAPGLVAGGLIALSPLILVAGDIAANNERVHQEQQAGPPPVVTNESTRKIIDTQSKLHPSFKTLLDTYRNENNGQDPPIQTVLSWLRLIRQGEEALNGATNEQRVPEDPNEIVGPAGFGTAGFIEPVGTFPYTIFFQNKPTAAVPAQEVFVTQQLDADLDWESFELLQFGWADKSVDVPNGLKSYHTAVDYPERNLVVDVTAVFDTVTGQLSWAFRSLDPITFDLPEDGLAGFLPPDDAAGTGQGFVRYAIQPKPGAVTGTRYDAQATIRFDTEAPLDTPPIVNTADVGDPTSTIAPLPAQSSSASFTVSWSGDDDASGPPGSGIAAYDVFVSDNGGPFTLLRQATAETTMLFVGQFSRTYAFFSVATDQIGHRQTQPAGAQAFTATPDSGPHITDVRLNADASGKAITLAVLAFDAALNEVTAENPSSFVWQLAGKDNRFGTGDDATIPIASAVYDDALRTVTLTPQTGKPLKLNQFVRITAKGDSGATNLNGTALDGDADNVPGGDFVRTLGLGTKLSYVDPTGDAVTLSIKKRGLIELSLSATGDPTVRLSRTVAASSALAGTVKKAKGNGADGRTSIAAITGAAGVSTAGLNRCSSPQATNCFELGVVSAMVVDSLLDPQRSRDSRGR
jgi:RHS repeat-associated protein